MRKTIFILPLVLAACSQEPASPTLATGSFAGEGRNRLCIEGSGDQMRAGLIVYGEGNANCSASGKLSRSGEQWALVPKGESDDGCRIAIDIAGGGATVGQLPPNCAYYCGAGASMSGAKFRLDRPADKATDLAGDSLC